MKIIFDKSSERAMVGDMIVTTCGKTFLIVQKANKRFDLLDLETCQTILIIEYFTLDKLLKDFRQNYTIAKVVKNKSIVITEKSMEDDWF